MVRSHIDYVLPVFGTSQSNKQIATLEKLQYRAARLTTGAMIRTSDDNIYKDLGWETINPRIRLFNKPREWLVLVGFGWFLIKLINSQPKSTKNARHLCI